MSFSTPPPPTPTWADWWPLYYYVTLVAVFFGLGCFKAHFPPGLGYLILALLVLFMGRAGRLVAAAAAARAAGAAAG